MVYTTNLWWWLGHGLCHCFNHITNYIIFPSLHRHHRLSMDLSISTSRHRSQSTAWRQGINITVRAAVKQMTHSRSWRRSGPKKRWENMRLTADGGCIYSTEKRDVEDLQKFCFSYQLCSHFGFTIGFQFLWIACWMLSNSKKLMAVNYGTRTCVIGSGNTCNCAGSG